jgi:signal transduction histidine kinase
MGLRAKLAITVLVLLSVAIVGVSTAGLDRSLRVMADGLMSSGDRIAKDVYEQMRDALGGAGQAPVAALRASQGLRTAIQSAQAFGEYVVYVRIVASDGTIMVAGERDTEGQRETPATPITTLRQRSQSSIPLALLPLLWGSQAYEVSTPVQLGGQPFAAIKIGLSTGLIGADARRLVVTMVGILLGSIFFTLLAVVMLSNRMLQPVEAITSGVEQLAVGNGEVNLVVGVRDELGTLADKFNQLSRRVRSERAQWESERGRLVDAFRAITDAVLLVDGDGSLLFANEEARRRLGLDTAGGQNEGKPLSLLLGSDHPLMQLVGPALSVGSDVHDVALELRDAEGTSARFLVSIFSLGHGPSPAGLLVMLRDLGRMNELETVVDYSSRLARLGGLLSGIGHQIRSPLNAMTMQLELVRQDAQQGKPVEQHVERVRREIRRLDRAIDALMRFMRPQELKADKISMNDLLKQIGSRLSQPKVRVQFDLEEKLPPIVADSALLTEALQNIVQNGAQAMPDGGVLTLRTSRPEAEVVEIEIADQGAGIPDKDLDHIFDLYYTTKQGGSGLGLPLALRAVDLHSGSIKVESRQGGGTTFRIRLPVANGAKAPLGEARSA